MIVVGKTKSICPICMKTIEAEKVLNEDKQIYMKKRCQEHGEFQTLIWEGTLKSYLIWGNGNTSKEKPVDPKKPSVQGCPHSCGLCSEHLRKGCCVLLEVTSRCNMKCPVCFASAGEDSAGDKSLEELEREYDYLMSHGGPFNIQLSGGEPTMRNDLPDIIKLGKQKGFSFFQLNTNGIRLANETGYAEELKRAGLDTVFLQFDGITDRTYQALRGKKMFSEKERAIENCRRAGLGIVLVPVIVPYVNEDEIGGIIAYALEKMPYVRGVHFQPVSYFGRYNLDILDQGIDLQEMKVRITIPRMLREIEKQTNGIMKYSDFSGGSVENAYCSFHAGYRKKTDGTLKALKKKKTCSCCVTSDESREFVSNQWSSDEKTEKQESDLWEISALDKFLENAHRNTFTVSGMIFQDAYNFDVARVRQCYINEMDLEHGMVPFCAYNMTDVYGNYLYRGKKNLNKEAANNE